MLGPVTRPLVRRLILLAAAPLLLAGCTSSHSAPERSATDSPPVAPSGSSSSPAAPSSTTAATSSPVALPPASHTSTSTPPGAVPRPDHVVVVLLENHSFDEVLGRPEAPFLNSLAGAGAVMTASYAVAHPSEPNYLALFSGSTQGVTSDACPLSFGGPNLASSLMAAGNSFTGYAEDLPSPGFTGCSAGSYARKHSPWVNFTNVPASANQPLASFPSRFEALPTVSFVIPNLDNDMHDGTLAQADSWLRTHLGGYASWAAAHNSLLVVTADEDDRSSDNRIATLLVGQQVAPGRYSQHVDHYGVLRTIEDAYGLPRLGASAKAAPITGVWRR